MAKITAKERQENARRARIHMVRYYAFSNVVNYFNAEYICDINKFRKMDVAESTKYYIEKGWMTGEWLKSYGSSINGCSMVPWHQCAIIAHCPESVAAEVISNALDEAGSGRRRSNTIHAENGDLMLTRALNAYCRSHPEVLSLFTKMDDMEVTMPDYEEQTSASNNWNMLVAQMNIEKLSGATVTFLEPLILREEFRDFFRAMPAAVLSVNVVPKLMQYQRFTMIDDTRYEYYMSLVDTDVVGFNAVEAKDFRDNLLFFYHFLKYGNVDEHLQQMDKLTKPYALLSAIKNLMDGKADNARKAVEQYLKKYKLMLFDDAYSNFIYLTALLKANTEASMKTAVSLLKNKVARERAAKFVLLMLNMKANPEMDMMAWVKQNSGYDTSNTLNHALFILVATANGYSTTLKTIGVAYYEIIKASSMSAVALDFAQVFAPGELPAMEQQTAMRPLLDKVEIKEPWEQMLEMITQKYGAKTATTSGGGRKKAPVVVKEMGRVVYMLNTNNWNVQPRLQKSKDGGVTWTGGRNIALKTFETGIPEMTPQDVMVSRHVETYSYGWYGATTYSLGGRDVVAALVGSPVVYDEYNHDLKIEIQEDKLQLQVEESDDGYRIISNAEKDGGTYKAVSINKENAQLLKVIKLTPQQIEILHLFDRAGVVPLKAKEMLTKTLSGISGKVTVMSSLLGTSDEVKKKKGKSDLTVQVVPYGDVFTVRCYVKPLTDTPPYCTPGKGVEYIAASIKGKAIQVQRNMKAEQRNMKAMLQWMEPFDEYHADDSWLMPMEECLVVLDLLREHQDKCRIEWPEGVRFCVRRPMIDADRLNISIRSVGQWLEVDGDVYIDDKARMKISELLKRVREAKGRFIQLDDNEYIAISTSLRKQLAAMDRVVKTEKDSIMLSGFNGSLIRELQVSGVSVSGDNEYQDLQRRLEEADSMKIDVPKMLQAELRDYQLEGYRWMYRLAHWGAGACLADDMGLGKTVQTIALLLSRAAEGASLVVMPTSLLGNWQNEILRFAPTLNPVILRNAADRKLVIENADKGDVVLVTYGLLPTEEELLVSRRWNVIVLDEAHAIKNKDTKTSKVAMRLDGQFRLLLTGTPLQNHLSEIWNLFQFATPGLLTDYRQFTEEFIIPIERDQAKEPQRLLKRMLTPFILRRTKSEVLSELPEKTEITLKVELSDVERALYEHLREEAVMSLENGGQASAIKALAEITKLRQVACNAALVLPAEEAKAIPSSKCEVFMRLVDELIQNHHRALVFSQFTSHLALIEHELQRRGIEYQYLDGTVSPAERLRRVEDFQKGEQPLFLISLKAGGTGLNLTSADYVIHLDPWWNPSIEDQASDRAYRIGQDKPVTVYRLIAADTIEEKIIALHRTKKSLADALLQGSDMAHRLSADEILEMIRV